LGLARGRRAGGPLVKVARLSTPAELLTYQPQAYTG
jgi:hypothetical protein